MKKGGILIMLIIFLAGLGIYFAKNWLFDRQQTVTSDASINVETIRYAKDSYIGYAPLECIEMKRQFARKGIALKATDDGGNYAERLAKFANDEYDFIVLPVNAYLQHGMQYKFPGVIVAGICESVGADVVLGFPDVMKTGKINDLNNNNLKFVYTPSSPSSFILDFTISDFDLDQLASSSHWRKEVNGSSEVYAMAEKARKDRSFGDVFVMWEPEVSKSINKLGLVKIWGSDQFRGYIIDVFVFSRNFVDKHPEKIKDFLSTYFTVLNQYSIQKDDFIQELSDVTSLNEDIVGNMLKEVNWYDLEENCSQLFGMQTNVGVTPKEGMINCILACNTVMQRIGSIKETVKNPYMIVNSSFLESLKTEAFKNTNPNSIISKTDQFVFDPLDKNEWLKLKEVGTVRIEDITFDQGSEKLDSSGENMTDKFALMLLNNYPQHRLIVKGHTGEGDTKANLELSQSRADMVRQRFIAIHNIDANRIFAIGYGAEQPPIRKPNENIRLYKTRWARVELTLVQSKL